MRFHYFTGLVKHGKKSSFHSFTQYLIVLYYCTLFFLNFYLFCAFILLFSFIFFTWVLSFPVFRSLCGSFCFLRFYFLPCALKFFLPFFLVSFLFMLLLPLLPCFAPMYWPIFSPFSLFLQIAFLSFPASVYFPCCSCFHTFQIQFKEVCIFFLKTVGTLVLQSIKVH